MQNQRPVTFTFLVGGIAVGVFVRSMLRAVMLAQGIGDPMLGGVAPLSLVLGVVSAALGFFLLMRHERARNFTDSVVSELRLVTWPTREETMNNTGIVVGATLFFAGLLAVYDFVWAKLTELVLYSAV